MVIQKINTTLDLISRDVLILNEPYILNIEERGVSFEFYLNLLDKSDQLTVMSSGAVNRDKIKPPVFHRHSWAEEINCSTIYINDPTLYLGPLNIGWGQGVENHFYIESIAKILKKLSSLLNIEEKNIYFYGSSCGGFISLYLSAYFKSSTAIVNNPQTNVMNYYMSHVNKLLELSYNGLSKEEIRTKYATRLSIIDYYKSIDYVPNIIYYQNLSCQHDVLNHLTPFIHQINELSGKVNGTNVIRYHFYQDQELGHNPLSKETTLEYLNTILTNRSNAL
ncbi:glycosyl transferase family 2 [Bacillus sp. NPDC077027]|uniref:glycosyl transferase family 2 n=1 Tax=Bacillus sp. NPDC077027 TaxID=3390548 RepID=UPI003CFE2C10